MGMSHRLLRPRRNRYLLDVFPGADVAYSLRRLRLAYTGAAVRVRRSSDNAEEDFKPEQIANGTLTSWTGANNGFVTTWYDQSGNGRDATQSTSANQPTLVSSGVLKTESNMPAIDFDGANDRLVFPGSTVSSITSLSQFCVVRCRDAANSMVISAAGQNANGKACGLSFSSSEAPRTFIWGATPEPEGAANTLSRVMTSCVISGTSISLFVNNGSAISGTASLSLNIDNNTVTIGTSPNNAFSLLFTGIMQEVLFFFTDKSQTRQDISNNINSYYVVY